MEQPVLDKEEALARLDGDLELWEEIRSIWLSDAGDLLDSVLAAARSKSADALRRAAHAMKGASANVGACRVSAAARAVEVAAPEMDWSRLESLVEVLRAETSRALEELPLA